MKSEEIAKLAGVSRSTVSRVINNYPNVPENTRERVMKVIKEYNYTPNTSARALAGKKSNTIGLFLIIDGKQHEDDRIFKNDYFNAYMNYLVDYAATKDYYVLVSIVSSSEHYSKIEQAFNEKRIDAGIIIGTQQDTLRKIHSEGFSSSMVVFDYEMTNSDKAYFTNSRISTINSMDYKGIQDAVEYLHDKGHRKIGFIKGRESSRSGRIRFEAYLKAMEVMGMTVYDEFIIEGGFDVEQAYSETQKMLENTEKLPTAIISANDFMALWAMNAIRESGLNIPNDISVIGFDNTLHSEITNPKLTTMGPDFEAMSQEAIDILDKQIKGDYEAKQVQYRVNFYERETCKEI